MTESLQRISIEKTSARFTDFWLLPELPLEVKQAVGHRPRTVEVFKRS